MPERGSHKRETKSIVNANLSQAQIRQISEAAVRNDRSISEEIRIRLELAEYILKEIDKGGKILVKREEKEPSEVIFLFP